MKAFASIPAQIPRSGIREIMDLAWAVEKTGEVIHLEVGQPDFDTPSHIVEATCRYANAGNTKYVPNAGVDPLREAAARYFERNTGIATGANNILVTPGAVMSVATSFLALLEPGDEVFFFGFSRGAYTVRAISGLINNCGILKRQDARLVTEAWRIYKSPSAKNHPRGEAAMAFRARHSHASRQGHFIGAWDTVGALGIPHSLMGLFERDDEFYDTKIGANASIVRQALAIDEKREDFEPTIWLPRAGVDMKQVWFAGVHTDVGGSYPPDKGTGIRASDTPLEWMLNEAEGAGLMVERHLRDSLTPGEQGKLHKSRKHVYRMKPPLQRELIVSGKPTLIHPSVRRRYEADPSYRPPQLKILVDRYGWEHLDVGA